MQLSVPIMKPGPGERLQRFVGDYVRFSIQPDSRQGAASGWRALLRTNLGRGAQVRREIVQAHTGALGIAGASWRDLPMRPTDNGWELELPLAEEGFFKAKAYLLDRRGWQHWPAGSDVTIAVHPSRYRCGNVIYCGFPRLFGRTKSARSTRDAEFDRLVAPLDSGDYTVIPPSGKLRDLVEHLPHIFETLGCRILHLLPVYPTPTTYARFGRFGSPYAALDLAAIDPALVVFDKRTTGIDQFRELTYATHLKGGRVFLDIVINHTGWGSALQENHPEWFLRKADGTFISPGAWGVTWEDLVELKHENVPLWDELAEVLLTWCQRGVDGFRCDAGYKVPVAAWQYIVARVQEEYPETMFLLEGLGGAWEATEALLADGGMQWAYSELFQNYSGIQVSGYLDHSFRQSQRAGLLVHYSETHDNDRLAAKGRAWSLLRNRLCGLASVSGGFGFTCGVEWLAKEKILVHGSTGLAWDSPENIVSELAALNRLISDHPCFFDGAKVTRLSSPESPVYALWRESEEGKDTVLVLVNTDVNREHSLKLHTPAGLGGKRPVNLAQWADLLGQKTPVTGGAGVEFACKLPPGAAYCLAPAPVPQGLHGDGYRRARALAAWGLKAKSQMMPLEQLAGFDWRATAAEVDRSPADFLASISAEQAAAAAMDGAKAVPGMTPLRVVKWSLADVRRVTLVPPGHWLLIEDAVPFRAALNFGGAGFGQNVESIAAGSGHIACFPAQPNRSDAILLLERYTDTQRHVEAAVRFVGPSATAPRSKPQKDDLVLLTNGRGGMARMRVDLGHVGSKYDCVLGANLHPTLPVDRHVFAKRIRVWVNADGFISPLDFRNLASFEAGPPAVWHFVALAGDGRTVEIQLCADMLPDRNTIVFHVSRPKEDCGAGKQLPAEADVRLTVRVDIEDRNFHWETKRNAGADHHFSSHVQGLPKVAGFAFTPAPDRRLRVFTDSGLYHPQPEWSENIAHPVEQSRGQTGSGDTYSPGWFELPLPKGGATTLVVTAEANDPTSQEVEKFKAGFNIAGSTCWPAGTGAPDAGNLSFEQRLLQAIRSFVVRRGEGKTIIAGYPWFLDWGRDTFIAARGVLAAGMVDVVKQILITFARFEHKGTLPNTIFGEDASNRDTSDAPLWFAVVCEEVAELLRTEQSEAAAREFYETRVDAGGRRLRTVLESIASHYAGGTPNRIRMDPASGLIWSPNHFTWMDTNYPAGTPREGYPVEIQAIWIRLLRQLDRLSSPLPLLQGGGLAALALQSLENYFWLEDRGYYADVLLAGPGQGAAQATRDDALRSNYLFVVSLGLAPEKHAQACIAPALRHLVVPGALRSLAPLPVSVPLPIRAADGRLLNDPRNPYWGRYEGDEDTRRKPAYHNGTAWTWTFPSFCEALARAWNFSPESVAAARAYLSTMAGLMDEGCLEQIPEILDGDAPHTARGCDAQAWSATEALRVWKLLDRK